MKLKFTTKLFIAVNAYLILFRTIQIIFLTEAKSAFLKTGLIAIDVVGMLLGFLFLTMLFSNTVNAVRQPKCINNRSLFSAVISTLCGILLIVSGSAAFVEQVVGFKLMFVFSLLGALSFFLYGLSCFFDYAFPKIAAIPLIAFFALQIVFSYLSYVGRPLRVRTVYEILALVFAVWFFSGFGKITSELNVHKHFRLMYPLGLVGASLCFVSFVPELIAIIFGFKSHVASSSINPLIIATAGLFMTHFTLNTFKKSNTSRPKSSHAKIPENEIFSFNNGDKG